jgi:hypothetical protein
MLIDETVAVHSIYFLLLLFIGNICSYKVTEILLRILTTAKLPLSASADVN